MGKQANFVHLAEDDPHEERARLGIVLLVRLEDVASVLEQVGRDGGGDARPVEAG
jgi:hypothetical protein